MKINQDSKKVGVNESQVPFQATVLFPRVICWSFVPKTDCSPLLLTLTPGLLLIS